MPSRELMLGAFVWLAVLASWSAGVRADAVGPCAPGFRASHSGCRFDPEPEEIGGVTCCMAGIGVLVIGGAALAIVARRARSSREP